MAEPRGFDTLPLGMAPFEIEGEDGRFLAVDIDGKIVGMREDAVKNRMEMGQHLQITTHQEYDHARAQEAMGGVGGAAITAGASVANGALLGLGIPFTAAALKQFDPELAEKFTRAIEQGREVHPGVSLVGELGGGITKLPGALVEGVVGVGKSAVGRIAGARAARLLEETARYKLAAETAQEALGGAARAGEAAALEGGIEAQRARAFVGGAEAGVPKALRRLQDEAGALPTTGLPPAAEPPLAGGRLKTRGMRIEPELTAEQLQEQARATRAAIAEAPEATASHYMGEAAGRMESRARGMTRAAADARVVKEGGAEALIAQRERRLEAMRGIRGEAKSVKALEEEIAALKQEHGIVEPDLGQTKRIAGSAEAFAEERMAERAAVEEKLDPLREAVRRQSLPHEAREAALARQAATEAEWAPAAKELTKEEERAANLQKLLAGAEERTAGGAPRAPADIAKELAMRAEFRGALPAAEETALRGVYEGPPLAGARPGRALTEVRKATEALPAEEAIALRETQTGAPRAHINFPPAEEGLRLGETLPGDLGKLGEGTVVASPVDRLVQQRGAAALGETTPGVAPMAAEGRAVTPPLTPEAAAAEAAATPREALPLESGMGAGPSTAGEAAFGEAALTHPGSYRGQINRALMDVYRQHPGAFPEELPGAFGRGHLENALSQVQRETLATEAEKIAAAEAKATWDVAKARADSIKDIADAMGTVPAALQPEFLVRAFIDGAGSRMTYNALHDKENTIPGIVGDGVMTAIAASAFHAGVSGVLSKFGSKAGSAIAKEEMAFQKASQSTDPAEMAGFIRRQIDNAVFRRVGLDTEEAIGSMKKYVKAGPVDPVTKQPSYAGGPQFVAETLFHDLPRAAGKKSFADFKNIDEIHAGINKAWASANEGIDRLVMEMDEAIAKPGPMGGAKEGMTTVASMFNALDKLEADAMATRTIAAGGPPVAKAVRAETVEFLRAQGLLREDLMKMKGTTLATLSNPEMVPRGDLPIYLKDGWEGETLSYAGLKNTANQMRLMSYAGDIDPALRGGKEVFAKFRGLIEETLEGDMDRMFAGRGAKYDYTKRNWQAWNYINEATEKKLLQQQVARIGSTEALTVLSRAAVTGYVAMFHPVTAAVSTLGFILPKAVSLNSVQNAWLGLLQKISGGIHIDNKRLAMAAAKEKGIDEFLKMDLSKIPAGKTKVTPASDVFETLLATRALTQNPQAAMSAMSQTAQSAGSIGPELAADTVSRTQKAIAMLSASLPRALKSDQWGQPDEEHLRVDPFELKRWHNVFQGITDPASVFDDLKMGDVPGDKIKAMQELYPEMMESIAQAINEKHSKKKSSISVKGAKVPLNLGQMKQPKFHYEKASAVKGLMGPHASIGMDKEHFQSAQDSYKTMEPQQGGGGGPPGGGGGGGEPPSRVAAYQSPFGTATGMATGTQITSRRA